MKTPTTKSILIVGIDETIRKDIAAAADLVKQTEVAIEKNTRGALSASFSKRPGMVILEWDVFTPEDITKFLQKFRKLSDCQNTPILFIVQKVATQPVAIAAEYDIVQVLTRASFAAKFGEIFKEASTEFSAPGVFRARLDAIADALKKGAPEGARKATEQLYKQFPEHPRAQSEYANQCLRAGDYPKAQELAHKMLAANPHNLRATNILARVQLHQRKFPDALAMLEKAEILSPRNLDRLVMLGDLFRETGNNDEARKHYGRALSVDDESPDARKGLALVELEENHLNEAMALFRDALSKEEVAGFYNAAGILAVRRRRYEQATQLYEAAIQVLSSDKQKARVHFNLGLAYERWNKMDLAKAAFANSKKLDPSFEKTKRRLENLNVGKPLDVDFDEIDGIEPSLNAFSPPHVMVDGPNREIKPFHVEVLNESPQKRK